MKNVLIGVAILSISIGFNFWLNAGCELDGAITLQGKVCYEDLLK